MKELLVTLDTSAKAFLYEQIYASLRRDILEGRLSCGERRPPRVCWRLSCRSAEVRWMPLMRSLSAKDI